MSICCTLVPIRRASANSDTLRRSTTPRTCVGARTADGGLGPPPAPGASSYHAATNLPVEEGTIYNADGEAVRRVPEAFEAIDE
jgi:hypothetical protein